MNYWVNAVTIADMKKIKLVAIATLVAMVSFSGCKTVQQLQVVIQEPQVVIQEPQVVVQEPQVVIQKPQVVIQKPQVVIRKEKEVLVNSEDEISDQQGITFFQGNFVDAFEKAKNENKLVFVDCYTTWCGPCKILKKYTFRDANLGDYMKDNYVSLAIDMETAEGQALAKKYGIEAYPTLLFLDKYGRVVNHQVGGIGAEALLAKAEQTVRKKM